MNRARTLVASLLVCCIPVLAGCGGGDDTSDGGAGGGSDTTHSGPVLASLPKADLSTADAAKAAAKQASAPNVFALSVLGLSLAQLDENATCPKKTVSGDVTSYDGGCTDANGAKWVGHVEEKAGSTASTGTITYDGFGETNKASCDDTKETSFTLTGTVVLTQSGDSTLDFKTDLVMEGQGVDSKTCAPAEANIAVDYTGSFVEGPDADMDGSPDSSTWSGIGRVGVTSLGVVDASTSDELIDGSKCGSEALSGTTTLKGKSHTVVVTYDGATKCDDTSTVLWSLDGKDQGELSGVSCSVGAPGGAGGGAAGFALLALAALPLARRRRRAGTSS